jgi:hypothetical protein
MYLRGVNVSANVHHRERFRVKRTSREHENYFVAVRVPVSGASSGTYAYTAHTHHAQTYM